MHFIRFLTFACIFHAYLVSGTTGKVTGKLLDTKTGEPLIGANVVLNGTSMGAATDIDGYYNILNVPPGFYDIKASMIGYSSKTVELVRVEIDLSSTVDISLSTDILQGEAITVTAEQKLVKIDVASSQKSISSDSLASWNYVR